VPVEEEREIAVPVEAHIKVGIAKELKALNAGVLERKDWEVRRYLRKFLSRSSS
jgi:hypothetical protein